MGDPEAPVFPAGYRADDGARRLALDSLILSASGWRKVFAKDGDGESRTEEISAADREIAAAMADTFAAFLLRRTGKIAPCMAAGIDTRFTGPRIAEVMIRVFDLRGVDVRYLYITPAPEIAAWVRETPEIDGFAYVTASHNPIGHNGVKFGLRGGVIGGEDSAELIRSFRLLAEDPARMESLVAELREPPQGSAARLRGIFGETEKRKMRAETAYERFTRRVVTDRGSPEEQNEVLVPLAREMRRRNCGIVAELNGSARTLGIDRRFLEEAGARVRLVNGRPRSIAHAIVPEGGSLELCRRELEAARRENPGFVFGYTPDNDGDRGNIVFYNEKAGRARALEAQEVFALACVSELAFLASRESGSAGGKLAVAVNDPTSLRIDRIAAAFGAEVRRAEVGEANVVALAGKLRAEGYTVRILGEGSNGGNITHPSEIRDPLSTIFALLKILYIPGIFEIWCNRIGRPDLFIPHPSLRDIMDTLPRFNTLSAYHPDALLTIRTGNHGVLKARYEGIFLREWDRRRKELSERFGLRSWEEINHEGIDARKGMGSAFRTGTERGGLSILLKDEIGTIRAFLWMRGSGTEPVFRIMTDAEGGDPDLSAYLLAWQRSMVLEADETG